MSRDITDVESILGYVTFASLQGVLVKRTLLLFWWSVGYGV